MRPQHHRIGLIVPSSNTTMEAEVPELLRRQQNGGRHGFSVHTARVRLHPVGPEALVRLGPPADDAVELLCDARVDAIVDACLVPAMQGGREAIADTELRLADRANSAARAARVLTSASALVGALRHLKVARVTLLAPYRKELTTRVAATLAEYDIDVEQSRSLEVVDHHQVGRLDPQKLLVLASQMDLRRSQALVLSACVQMPSLAVIEQAEQRFGLPVLSAATASVFELLNRLDIEPDIRDAGSLLRARHRADARR